MLLAASCRRPSAKRWEPFRITGGGEFQSRFSASVPGYSVLLFTGFPPSRDLQTHPPIIQIIRTLPYDTGISVGGQAVFTDAVSCEIGEEILEPTHEEHAGKIANEWRTRIVANNLWINGRYLEPGKDF